MFEFRVMLVTFLSFPFKNILPGASVMMTISASQTNPKVCLCVSDEGLFFIVLVVIMME